MSRHAGRSAAGEIHVLQYLPASVVDMARLPGGEGGEVLCTRLSLDREAAWSMPGPKTICVMSCCRITDGCDFCAVSALIYVLRRPGAREYEGAVLFLIGVRRCTSLCCVCLFIHIKTDNTHPGERTHKPTDRAQQRGEHVHTSARSCGCVLALAVVGTGERAPLRSNTEREREPTYALSSLHRLRGPSTLLF